IFLTTEDKLTYLEHPLPDVLVRAPCQQLPHDVLTAHTNWVKAYKEIDCLMLVNMTPELQKSLRTLLLMTCFRNSKRSFHNKQNKNYFIPLELFTRQSVSSYILKLKSYLDNLECLGHSVSLGLAMSLILTSLSKEYDGFIHNSIFMTCGGL
ncbi:hypothetical protein Tco_1351087, partial [Tanacetum coccineum]